MHRRDFLQTMGLGAAALNAPNWVAAGHRRANQNCPGAQGRIPGKGWRSLPFSHYVRATGNSPSSYGRKGHWKFIRFYADNSDQTDRFELYNLKNDIGEKSGLADKTAERVRRLKSLIASSLQETNAVLPIPDPNYKGSEPGG